jgi:uncharacterized membrane protein
VAVQTFEVGDRVQHRADPDAGSGRVDGFGEEPGWVRVVWDDGFTIYHPDVNLVKEV